jgi:predicted acylesterase/phospholipase RssA
VGLQIVQKSDLKRPRKKKPSIALVLAGGAISGGAFKLGGLIALNTYLEGTKITDFDIYVGVSAGALVAAPLAAGVPPEELIRSLHGGSAIISQFKPWHFYRPNFYEYASRPSSVVRDAVQFGPKLMRSIGHHLTSPSGQHRVSELLSRPSYPNLEKFFAPIIRDTLRGGHLGTTLMSYLPTGIFDNRNLEKFIRENLRRNRIPNNFRLLRLERKNSLYVAATNLNTARPVYFGHDEDSTLTISEACQASSAIPGFFKPARINGTEYIDGGVQRTANMSLAARKNADLIICYNPFRPFLNLPDGLDPNWRSMGSMGPGIVLDQTFRSLLHSRLEQGIQRLAHDPRFQGDLLVLEPTETDARMFSISPLAFWKRALAAEAGYLSVKATLEQHHGRVSKIFEAYGIRTNLKRLQDDESALRIARRSDQEVFDILEHEEEDPSPQRLYLVR